MAINLTSTIADIEAKVAAANSSTSISDLYKIIIEATKAGAPVVEYDSAGAMPVDSAHVGSVLSTSAGGLFVLDSAGGSWQTAVGSPPPIPYTFQGSNYGYSSGGQAPSITPAFVNIEKFPFAADTNTTYVGNLSVSRTGGPAGQSSSISGYTAGGNTPTTSNIIDKFSFTSDGNATDVGDLTNAVYWAAGQSAENYGYKSGGRPLINVIDKFPFSADTNATDIGDLTTGKMNHSGQSSSTDGYVSGGKNPGLTNVIEKFSFSTDGNATDVGDLSVTRWSLCGQSSSTSGYTTGGLTSPSDASQTNVMDRFPFAVDANATDVGDLTVARSYMSGQSSTQSGYTSGGTITGAPYYINTIDKFPFAADANATDVGDLLAASAAGAGQQY